MIDCSKTVNFIKEKHKMTNNCQIRCAKCPLSQNNNGADNKMTCYDFEERYPEKAIKIVQKWSDEHPQKTYLTELLKVFPNAQLNDSGTPKGMCPHELGLKDIDCEKTDNACVKCWNQAIPIEDGEE